MITVTIKMDNQVWIKNAEVSTNTIWTIDDLVAGLVIHINNQQPEELPLGAGESVCHLESKHLDEWTDLVDSECPLVEKMLEMGE